MDSTSAPLTAAEPLTTAGGSKPLPFPLQTDVASVTRHSSFSSHLPSTSSTSPSPSLPTSRPSSALSSSTSTPSSSSTPSPSLSSSSQPVSPRLPPSSAADDRPLPALSRSEGADEDSIPPPPCPPSPPLPSFVAPTTRIRADGYVGLTNAGATCYLNSLLQSLFFTPEFRTALLYQWEYIPGVHPSPLLCIPYQLQLLFARLLCSVRPAVETAALTKSFRWTDAESFRQHDIQELMRVMFAALEKSMAKKTPSTTLARTLSSSSATSSSSTPSSPAGSPQLSPSPSSPLSPSSSSFPSASPSSPSFVHQLYCGQLNDYIVCLTCNNRRQRLDEFLDLSLDVAECASLEEALQKFVQSETLTGDNRWRCDVCREKVEAKKGLTLHKLPPILTIQLKRFVFDFTVQQRAKLQHRVTFPEMLDLQSFISAGDSSSLPSPLLYDLFAVLMHSGTANGGHYFSYIRSANGPFLEFNDTNVWHVPDNALELAYGGGKGACAYLLVYRTRELELAAVKGGEVQRLLSLEELERETTTKEEGWQLMKQRGVKGVEEEKEDRLRQRLEDIALLPPSVKAVIDAEDAVYLQQHAEQERERRRLEVTVVHGVSEQTLHLDQEQRMAEALRAAADAFHLSPALPIDCLRFRRYDRVNEWSAEPYPALLTLSQCHFSKRSCVQLEVREEGQDWPMWNPSLIPIRVVHARTDNLQSCIEQSHDPAKDSVTLSVDSTLPLSVIGAELEAAFSVPISCQRLIRLHDDKGEVLTDLSAAPQSLHLQAGHVLYMEDTRETSVETSSSSPTASPSSLSPLCQQLDLSKCQIKLLFNLPAQTSDDADASATPPPDDQHDGVYDQALHVSKHQTVRHLKALMSPLLSLPPSAFRLSRNESSPHFKDLDATLSQVGLVDWSAVHVSLGRQCEKDELNLKVYLLQSTAPVRSSSSYLYLFDLPVTTSTSVAQLKVALLTQLNTQFGDVKGAGNGFGVTYFRLREKKGNLSSRVFEDQKAVGEVLQDEADVCIERCETEEDSRVQRETFIVRCAWWDGHSLSSETELTLRKMVMVGAVRQQLQAAYTAKHKGGSKAPVKVDDPCPPLFLAKGMARVRMRPSDVAKVHWLSADDLPDAKLAKNLPLRLAAGDLLLVTTITPASHTAKTAPPPVPEAPAMDVPPPPPGPPPAAGYGSSTAVEAPGLVNKPAESVISQAKARLKRSVGGKGMGDGVLVKGARIYPVREYGLHIDLEDEVEAIERACAEADRAEREREKKQKEDEELQRAATAAVGAMSGEKEEEESKEPQDNGHEQLHPL